MDAGAGAEAASAAAAALESAGLTVTNLELGADRIADAIVLVGAP